MATAAVGRRRARRRRQEERRGRSSCRRSVSQSVDLKRDQWPAHQAYACTIITRYTPHLLQVKNIRDLASVSGSGIKPGRLYRTGYLSKASPEDVRDIYIYRVDENFGVMVGIGMGRGWV